MIWDAEAALADLDAGLIALADRWAKSPQRPRVDPKVLLAWDQLLDTRISSEVPLPCRTPSWGRGAEDLHPSGRILTCADNTPAHWAMALAIAGQTPTLDDVARLFETGTMPLAFAIKKSEKDRLRYARGGLSAKLRLNKDGWKVCHIEAAGLRWAGHPTGAPIEMIHAHFRRFLSPRNMFLIPLSIGGLGETPQMIARIKASPASG